MVVVKANKPAIFSQGAHAVKVDMIKELQCKYTEIFKPEQRPLCTSERMSNLFLWSTTNARPATRQNAI